MKQADIIRLGIIGVALVLAYHGIVYLIGFFDYFLDLVVSSEKPGGRGFFNILLTIAGYFAGSFLLIRYSRRISIFIEEQK